IGDSSPTLVGMAVFTGCGAAVSCASEYGQFLYTCRVYSANFFVSGLGITDRAPLRVVPMYGYGIIRRAIAFTSSFSLFSSSSLVNSGLAFDCKPLPTPTRMFLPSGVTATLVGYQPVGMNPRTRLIFGSSISTQATQLLSALATYSHSPFGLIASASG